MVLAIQIAKSMLRMRRVTVLGHARESVCNPIPSLNRGSGGRVERLGSDAVGRSSARHEVRDEQGNAR